MNCKNRAEFEIKYGGAYFIVYKNKWYELFSHLSENKKPNEYWTYDKCKEVALECESNKNFRKKYSSAYKKIIENDWLELISHFKKTQKPKGYWTYDKCKDAALECSNINELCKKYGVVHNLIYKNKWTELISHFPENKKPNGYWTYDKCKNESLKYIYRSEFCEKTPTAYRTVLKNNWIELLNHMERIGNKRYRLIYVYEFLDNCCYVGLTCNMKRRDNQHLGKEKYKDSSVYKHILKTGLTPKLIIKSDYIDVKEAILLEEKILLEYKSNYWITLNEVKTGGIGSNDVKWTIDKCREAASKCKNASQFGKNCGGAYNFSAKYNLLDEFFPNTSKKGYWNNKDLCFEESKKYSNRSEFMKNNWHEFYKTVIDMNWEEYLKIMSEKGEYEQIEN